MTQCLLRNARKRSLPLAASASVLFLCWLFVSTHTAAAQQSVPVSSVTLFHEKGCEHCHGTNFSGVPDKGPSLLTVGKHLKKDAIAKQIRSGGQEMPAFGDALQPDEVSALVDLLSRMKRAPKGAHATNPY